MTRLFYVVGLFTLALGISYGQTAVAEANVPFDFHMGQAVMPAGSYRILESNGLLIVSAVRGAPSARVLTLPTTRRGKSSNPQLQFERYGSEYYLEEIWPSNSREGLALHRSKQEQELASRAASKPVEVALERTVHPSNGAR